MKSNMGIFVNTFCNAKIVFTFYKLVFLAHFVFMAVFAAVSNVWPWYEIIVLK